MLSRHIFLFYLFAFSSHYENVEFLVLFTLKKMNITEYNIISYLKICPCLSSTFTQYSPKNTCTHIITKNNTQGYARH